MTALKSLWDNSDLFAMSVLIFIDSNFSISLSSYWFLLRWANFDWNLGIVVFCWDSGSYWNLPFQMVFSGTAAAVEVGEEYCFIPARWSFLICLCGHLTRGEEAFITAGKRWESPSPHGLHWHHTWGGLTGAWWWWRSDPSLCACMLSFSCVQHHETLWTEARQAPLSVGFSRQEHWSGLPYPPPGGLPNPRIKSTSLMCPALAGTLPLTPLGEPSLFLRPPLLAL